MRSRSIWVAGAVVALGVAITVIVASRHHSSPRGASTPKIAATLFVGAANSGSGSGTAAVSCASFAAQAGSLARSGADPGISFTLGTVSTEGASATAVIDEALDVGGSTQHQQYTLTLQSSGGLWLVCGER